MSRTALARATWSSRKRDCALRELAGAASDSFRPNASDGKAAPAILIGNFHKRFRREAEPLFCVTGPNRAPDRRCLIDQAILHSLRPGPLSKGHVICVIPSTPTRATPSPGQEVFTKHESRPLSAFHPSRLGATALPPTEVLVHESRNTKHETRLLIACFDRRVVGNAGQVDSLSGALCCWATINGEPAFLAEW